MTADLMRRLVRLEDRRAPPVEIETSFTPALRLLRLLIAVHLGNLRPGEDVTAGEARALGFDTAAGMRDAMAAERTAFIGWGSQQNIVIVRLLAENGASASGHKTSRNVLAALLAALPAPFADHPDADLDALSAASEWVSL